MIIGFDPGYGNTKVCIDGAVFTLQSAVARPRQIGMAGIGMHAAAQVDQVSLGAGVEYATGAGAWLLGEPINGMDFATLAGEPRRALFYGAVSHLLEPGDYTAEMVVGLPVPLLNNQAEAQAVLEALKVHYKTMHTWQANGGLYDLKITRLMVLAQPVGAYADWLLNDHLRPIKGGKDAEVAVLDLGMNTLDLYVIVGGKVVSRFVGGARVGCRRLLATMNGHGQDLEELDAGLRAGTLRPTQSALDAWLAEVLSHVEKTWPSLKRFSAVIPCGGGAMVLGDLLRQALVERGAAVAAPDDPIATNARGLYKWAGYNARK